MEQQHPFPWGEVVRYLKNAALYPHQRGEMLSRALQEFLACPSVVATALLWPSEQADVGWKIFYFGLRQEAMRRWLSARLKDSLDITIGTLQQDLSLLVDMPHSHLMSLQPSSGLGSGLWLVWTAHAPLSDTTVDCLERIRLTLEAVLEVAYSENHYFSQSSPLSDHAVIEALAQGENYALSVFLSMARLVGKADFTFWGRVYQDVTEVNTHLGAKQSDFGFAIPHGRGVGGRIVTYGTSIVRVDDYRNSSYRDPSVSDIVDSEQIRSGIALPVRYSVGPNAQVAAILYATRRTPTPFSLSERLLVQRLTRMLEPLPIARRPSSFLSLGLPQLSDQKAAWYDLVLHANRMEVLETWVGQYIQGTVVVTDSEGVPYVATDSEQLERLQAGVGDPIDAVQVLSLSAPGVSLPGEVYLRGAVSLPPQEWPDFFTDLVMACNLVIGRMEKAYDQLARQREHWLRSLLQEKSPQQLIPDGYRLGLPIEQGQLWVIAWSTPTTPAILSARKRMLTEGTVLEHLKCPLLFFGDDLGVILLDEHAQQQDPAKLRDALLKLYAPHPLWIVYGIRYQSLGELKTTLSYAIALAQRARRETRSEYLLDMQAPGLESLLENPRLTEDLRNFAARLFAPLLEHDTTKSTRLTETFVLAQTLGSVQMVADQLTIHVNTVRYRLHKVEELLGIEQASPKERTAWALAAFVWQHFDLLEKTPPKQLSFSHDQGE